MNNAIKSINKHYSDRSKVQLSAAKSQRDNLRFYSNFNKLLVYSNGLIDVYENAIKGFKSELEKSTMSKAPRIIEPEPIWYLD